MVVGIFQKEPNGIERVRDHIRETVDNPFADEDLFSGEFAVQTFLEGVHLEELLEFFVLPAVVFALG